MCIQHMLTVTACPQNSVLEYDAHTFCGEARPFLNNGCTREPLGGRTPADVAVREKRWQEARSGFPKGPQPVRGRTWGGVVEEGDRIPPILACGELPRSSGWERKSDLKISSHGVQPPWLQLCESCVLQKKQHWLNGFETKGVSLRTSSWISHCLPKIK